MKFWKKLHIFNQRGTAEVSINDDGSKIAVDKPLEVSGLTSTGDTTISGTMTVNNINTNDHIATGSVTARGAIDANNAIIKNKITAKEATINGVVDANSAKITTKLEAATGSFNTITSSNSSISYSQKDVIDINDLGTNKITAHQLSGICTATTYLGGKITWIFSTAANIVTIANYTKYKVHFEVGKADGTWDNPPEYDVPANSKDNHYPINLGYTLIKFSINTDSLILWTSDVYDLSIKEQTAYPLNQKSVLQYALIDMRGRNTDGSLLPGITILDSNTIRIEKGTPASALSDLFEATKDGEWIFQYVNDDDHDAAFYYSPDFKAYRKNDTSTHSDTQRWEKVFKDSYYVWLKSDNAQLKIK